MVVLNVVHYLLCAEFCLRAVNFFVYLYFICVYVYKYIHINTNKVQIYIFFFFIYITPNFFLSLELYK